MKKILLLFLMLCFALPTMALTEEEQKQIMSSCENLYSIALNSKKADDYIESFKCIYNQKNFEKLDKKIKDNVYMFLITKNMERYELTKQKKYLNECYKWSKKAVEENTDDLFSIESAILFSSLKVKPQEVIDAYDLLCSKNEIRCKEFRPRFDEVLAATNELKNEKKEKSKQRWKTALKYAAIGISAGAAGYATGYSNASKKNVTTSTSTRCNTIGNTLYCNSNSY